MNDNKVLLGVLVAGWVVLTIGIVIFLSDKYDWRLWERLEKWGMLVVTMLTLIVMAYYNYKSNQSTEKALRLSEKTQNDNYNLQKDLYDETVKSNRDNKNNMDSTYLLNKNLADLQEKNFKSSIEYQEKTFKQTATLTMVNAKLQAYVFLQERVNATVNELIGLQRPMYSMNDDERMAESMRISIEVMEISRRLSDSIISYARFFDGIDESEEYQSLFFHLDELRNHYNKMYEVNVYRAAERFLQKLSETIFDELKGKPIKDEEVPPAESDLNGAALENLHSNGAGL